jgi:hypothetical protein
MRAWASASCDRKQHLGMDFTVWENEGAWVWLLIDPSGEGGMIGASPNEAQATHDAGISIEEKLAPFRFKPRRPRTLNQLKTTLGLAHAF